MAAISDNQKSNELPPVDEWPIPTVWRHFTEYRSALAYLGSDYTTVQERKEMLRVRDVFGSNCEGYLGSVLGSHADLLQSIQALGAMPDGFCFCFGHVRDPLKPEDEHTGEYRELRAAIAKAEGR